MPTSNWTPATRRDAARAANNAIVMELGNTGLGKERPGSGSEYYQIYVGGVLVSEEFADMSRDWKRQVEFAKVLIRAANGEIKDIRS